MGVAFTTQPFLDTMIISLGIFCLVGVVLGAPLQDTPEVLEAKEKFLTAFETAREGKHAALAPVNNDIQAPQIANAYLDETESVAEEKAKFKIAFDTAEAGGLKHMQAEQIANFYIAKVDEVAAAEAEFMKEFDTAEKGEHIKYAPVNNDVQVPQIKNEYLPYTQDVIDAANQFMTYFAEAKLKAMEVAAPMVVEAEPAAVDAAPVAVEAAPAVAAVKSVVAVDPAPAVVVPTVYKFPAFTYPITHLQYFLIPPAPLATVNQGAAVPVAAEAPAVE